MSVLCLSDHCILKADSLLSSFIGLWIERSFCPTMDQTQGFTNTNLDDEIWNFFFFELMIL